MFRAFRFKEKEIKNNEISQLKNTMMRCLRIAFNQRLICIYLLIFLDCYSMKNYISLWKSIVSDTNPRFLRVTFILLDDEKTVEEYYSEYPSLSCNSDLIHFLNTKYEEVARGAEEGIWK